MNALSILVSKIAQLRDDRRGVTALEYGLIAALIAVAIVSSVTLVGTGVSNTFTTIANKL